MQEIQKEVDSIIEALLEVHKSIVEDTVSLSDKIAIEIIVRKLKKLTKPQK